MVTTVKFMHGPCDGLETEMDTAPHDDKITYGVPAGMAPGVCYSNPPEEPGKHMHIYTSLSLGGVDAYFYEVIPVWYEGMFPVVITDKFGACEIERDEQEG